MFSGHADFRGDPYFFLGRRPIREERLRTYGGCGTESFCWRAIQDARTIEALERDVRETLERYAAQW
jgi:hypothetical protein